ncbi:MAG TPA: methylmalonyl Co-A mutase-associated GTPase MeaB [Longimicrobiales bacterium]
MIDKLWQDFEAGKRTALARAISIVENRREGFLELMNRVHPKLGRAQRIGITGPPGAGKSTLSAALTRHYRNEGRTVAVVAVDPTSPFTGGALLGDRIRMNEVALDEGVFIRSMATRGSLGGLSITTKEVADVMDAFGFDYLLIETVGVGQSELDVAAAADTTVVVLVPESGDSIQAMKAGLMEIADLFVINKADRPGADRLAREVDMMLHLRLGNALKNVPAHHGVIKSKAARTRVREADPNIWSIPVLQTVAETARGVPELAQTIARHRAWLDRSGELAERRRTRLKERVREAVERQLQQVVWRERGGERILEESLGDLEAGTATPYVVADRIVAALNG